MDTINRGSAGWGGKSTSVGVDVSVKPKSGVKVAPNYRACSNTFQDKIHSFKTLFGQTCGSATKPRPTTAVLNTFANWINKGAIVQTCTTAQVTRWARSCKKNFNARTGTPTTCRNILTTTFGKNTIKAVARTKTGSFMVATMPTWKGKPFCFPK